MENNIQNIFNKICTYVMITSYTILNSKNRIFLNFLTISPKTDFFKEIVLCCFCLFIVPYHVKTSQENP